MSDACSQLFADGNLAEKLFIGDSIDLRRDPFCLGQVGHKRFEFDNDFRILLCNCDDLGRAEHVVRVFNGLLQRAGLG